MSQEALYTLFVEYLDGIYYNGYAAQIAHQNPELFTFEWREFIRIHEPQPFKVIRGDCEQSGGKIVKHPASIKIDEQQA